MNTTLANPKDVEKIKARMKWSYSTELENPTEEKKEVKSQRALLVSVLKTWRPRD